MELPAHQLTMSILMTPDTANFSGHVHGGAILKLLDQVINCEQQQSLLSGYAHHEVRLRF